MVRAAVLALVAIVAAGPMVSTVDAQTTEAVAIIVHPLVAEDDLSLDDLKSIFLAEQQHWGDNSRITLFVRAPIAPERDLVLSEIYGMSEDRYGRYWIAKTFSGNVRSKPRLVGSTELLRNFVMVIPGSIGFVPMSEVGPNLKVIRIDGLLPGDDGYPLM